MSCNATFPGITAIKRVNVTLTLGPFPGIATVHLQPQANFTTLSGDLVITDGTNTRTLTGCIVDTASLKVSTNGHIEVVKLWDRRRLWKYTEITGLYNERDLSGEVITETEKTVHELATMLLDAMGETGYDIADLPNELDDRPFVSWKCDNPALELFRLCQERGCDIALLTDNTVKIVVIGTGASLPNDGFVKTVSFGADNGEVPEKIKVCGADTLYQFRLKLVPVGMDTNGDVKKIKDLSYAPEPGVGDYSGWEKVNPVDPLANSTDDVDRALAAKTVFRMYQVSWIAANKATTDPPVADDVVHLPTIGDLPSIRYILPINDHKATATYGVGGSVVMDRATIVGLHVPRQNQVGNSSPVAEVGVPFTINKELGIVLFDGPVYRMATDDEVYADATAESYVYPADIWLETSFSARDPDDNQYMHYEYEHTLTGTGTHVVRRPDLQRIIKGGYFSLSDPSILAEDVDDNNTTVNTLVDAAIIPSILPEFATYTSHEVEYIGIRTAIELDGAVRQISYYVDDNETGQGGAFTRAARNSEPALGLLRRRDMISRANGTDSLMPAFLRQFHEFSQRRKG